MTDFRRTLRFENGPRFLNNEQQTTNMNEQNPNDEISLKELIEKGQEWYNYCHNGK
jgi:hypothetical protein